MFRKLFRLYEPYGTSVNHDSNVLIPNTIGGALIAVSFISIGILCIILSKKDYVLVGNVYRGRIAQLFGFFLLTCGFSRAMDVLGLWYNYALINAYLKCLTGLVSFLTVLYTPKFIKKLQKNNDFSLVKQQMSETSERVDKLKEVADKLVEGRILE